MISSGERCCNVWSFLILVVESYPHERMDSLQNAAPLPNFYNLRHHPDRWNEHSHTMLGRCPLSRTAEALFPKAQSFSRQGSTIPQR